MSGPMMWMLTGLGVAFLVFMGALCVLLLVKMWKNEIDLSTLLQEANGDASMARFQLLIFTLVVAVGIFLFIVNKLVLPDIPTSILTLLGISASTFAVSKGISYSRDEGVTKPGAVTSDPADAGLTPVVVPVVPVVVPTSTSGQ